MVMDLTALMSMFGQGAGAATAATAAPAALSSAMLPAAQAATFAAPAAPALGSGLFGVQGVAPGIMQMGAAGPLGTGAIAQGTGPLLGLLQDPSTLDKLAGAPIDPMKLMKMLDEDGQQRAPQAPMPQGSRGLGQVSAPSTLAFDPRGGLSTFLGK
jgi:hypothetical protein